MTSDVKVLTTSSAKAYASWTTAPKKPDLKILFRTAIGSISNDSGKEVLLFFECWSVSFFECTLYLNISFVFYTNMSSICLHRYRKPRTKLGVFREESETIAYCYDQKALKTTMLFLFLVPLGSVPELPTESCAEIRASEGEGAVSGNYWFDSIKPGEVVLARCDMSKLGKSTFGVLPQFNTSSSSNKPLL